MAGRGVAERRVLKIGAGGEARRARDRLAVEEPLELRVAGRPVGVTMRTPGNDVELAIGYCISERLVARPDDVEAVRICAPEGQAQEFNVLTVDLRPGVPLPDRRHRRPGRALPGPGRDPGAGPGGPAGVRADWRAARGRRLRRRGRRTL